METIETRAGADVLIRPMRPGDVPQAERLSALAFAVLDGRADVTRPPERAAAWQVRTTHLVAHDAAGCWVADADGEMVGFATSLRREGLWALATYAVHPTWQGVGVGRALLRAAAQHGRGALRRMVGASSDPRAARRYRAAGLELHPTMVLEGTVDPGRLDLPGHVRDGRSGDHEWMDSLDRGLRGAGRGDDHVLLTTTHQLRVVDRPHRRGYAYLAPDSTVELLAASDRRTASELLTDALLGAGGADVRQPHVTAANQWALDVGMAAGLSLRTRGYLCLAGMKPPSPYLHHGALL
ncbi:GNAT family N-acetyltransferase [Nocardioides daphniae]